MPYPVDALPDNDVNLRDTLGDFKTRLWMNRIPMCARGGLCPLHAVITACSTVGEFPLMVAWYRAGPAASLQEQ